MGKRGENVVKTQSQREVLGECHMSELCHPVKGCSQPAKDLEEGIWENECPSPLSSLPLISCWYFLLNEQRGKGTDGYKPFGLAFPMHRVG